MPLNWNDEYDAGWTWRSALTEAWARIWRPRMRLWMPRSKQNDVASLLEYDVRIEVGPNYISTSLLRREHVAQVLVVMDAALDQIEGVIEAGLPPRPRRSDIRAMNLVLASAADLCEAYELLEASCGAHHCAQHKESPLNLALTRFRLFINRLRRKDRICPTR